MGVTPDSRPAHAGVPGHGCTAENALEVVLGVGADTVPTLANRLVRAPLDDRLMAFAWPEP